MAQRKRIEPAEHVGARQHLNRPTQVLAVFLAVAGLYLYAHFIFNPANRGDWLPYLFVILAESFLMFQAAVAMWTILVGGYNPRDFHYYDAQGELLSRKAHTELKRARELGIEAPELRAHLREVPLKLHGSEIAVDVVIPVYGEPVGTIRRTAEAARDLVGEHGTYILDDGKSDAVAAMAAEIGVGYIRRSDNAGAKAGNINHALAQLRGQFFAIFDADFVADPLFLYETVPFFADASVAFVQTPQHYGNLHNVISRGAGYMQRVFYRLIQPGKNRFNSAFCVGTNVIFRRSAIDEIGGMYQKSNSEDIWTSLVLHEHGYRSVFIPDILAVGDTPDTIKAYVRQQLRWATGGFEILLRHNPLFLRKLTIDQRIQYLVTTMFYLQGVAIGLLLLLPPLHIFFNLTPVNLTTAFGTWLVYYLGFYGMQVAMAFYVMGGFRWETLLVSSISFPVYVKALVNVLLGRKEKWHVTGKRELDTPFNYIVAQMLIFLFLAFTTVMAVVNMLGGQAFSIAIVWNMLNTVIYGCFMAIAYREHRELVRSRRAERKADKSGLGGSAKAKRPKRPLRSRRKAGQAPQPVATAAAATVPPAPTAAVVKPGEPQIVKEY